MCRNNMNGLKDNIIEMVFLVDWIGLHFILRKSLHIMFTWCMYIYHLPHWNLLHANQLFSLLVKIVLKKLN